MTAEMTGQRSFFTASVAEELLLNTELTEESKDRAIHPRDHPRQGADRELLR